MSYQGVMTVYVVAGKQMGHMRTLLSEVFFYNMDDR